MRKGLTWYALPTGPAYADSGKPVVRRFTGLFEYEKLTVHVIAFGRDKVWIGTDKGLMAWDRATEAWLRYAVEGLHAELPVTEVALGDDGLLRITLQHDGKARRFRYDPAADKWQEVP